MSADAQALLRPQVLQTPPFPPVVWTAGWVAGCLVTPATTSKARTLQKPCGQNLYS